MTERFWSKVASPNGGGCREWTAGRWSDGYGQFWLDGKHISAHVVAWTQANGPLPPGLQVNHHCDNPPCVEPSHLYAGTSADNSRDRDVRGRTNTAAAAAVKRAKTHCPQGHPYSEENTYLSPSGSRHCRACNRDARRRSRAKRKSA